MYFESIIANYVVWRFTDSLQFQRLTSNWSLTYFYKVRQIMFMLKQSNCLNMSIGKNVCILKQCIFSNLLIFNICKCVCLFSLDILKPYIYVYLPHPITNYIHLFLLHSLPCSPVSLHFSSFVVKSHSIARALTFIYFR